MDNIHIQCGDALSLFQHVDDAHVDLVIADPPYNLGKNYGNESDAKSHDDYLRFSRTWLSEACRVLKPGGSLYVFMGVRYISYIFSILENEIGMNFHSWLVWHYTQGLGKKRGFSPRHDDILVFTKGDAFKFNLDAIRVPQKYYRARNNMRGANPGDVWQFSHVHYSNPNRQDHPTQKPEGLIERMVLASSDAGDVVLDPFLGSGTTARVCQILDRRCIGFELNTDYVANTVSRLKQPFDGFDSMDPRMARVPNDLRDPHIRDTYLAQHIEWFLTNHGNAFENFKKEVKRKYGCDVTFDKSVAGPT